MFIKNKDKGCEAYCNSPYAEKARVVENENVSNFKFYEYGNY